MTQRYEVQTKFIYGFENVWRDEDGKLIYFDTREQAIKELRENVDDWNNDPAWLYENKPKKFAKFVKYYAEKCGAEVVE